MGLWFVLFHVGGFFSKVGYLWQSIHIEEQEVCARVRTHTNAHIGRCRHMGSFIDQCLHQKVFGMVPTISWVDLQMSVSVYLLSTAHQLVQGGIFQFSFRGLNSCLPEFGQLKEGKRLEVGMVSFLGHRLLLNLPFQFNAVQFSMSSSPTLCLWVQNPFGSVFPGNKHLKYM